MATEKQIDANRRNAQQSTGPRTDAGKTAASMNALKTGLYAQSSIIPGEDAEAYAALNRAYLDHYDPQTPVELAHVENLVRAHWRGRRLENVENQTWAYYLANNEKVKNPDGSPVAGALGRQFHFDALNINSFTKIARQIHSNQRMLERAAVALDRLQRPAPILVPTPKLASISRLPNDGPVPPPPTPNHVPPDPAVAECHPSPPEEPVFSPQTPCIFS